MGPKRLAEEAGIQTDCVRELEALSGGTLYRAEVDVPGEVFTLDTDSGLRIAAEPELVGLRLEAEALQAARAASQAISRRLAFDSVIFLHVLRASRGYMLHKALWELGRGISEVFIRVAYPEASTGSHASRSPSVVLARAEELPRGPASLVVAETVATGRSLVSALGFLLELAEFKGARVGEVHVYGFLSEVGVRRVAEFLQREGVERVYFYAVQDLTALASNEYDMPLYGPDLPSHKSGRRVTLGGVTAERTLERMLPHYFPGMDQPGDWSERQCELYNGESYERGRVREHLERSLRTLDELLEAAREHPWYGDWVERIYAKRRQALLQALQERSHCAARPEQSQ
uniref:Uncharacterized protein n=1 Tax=Thermofilum pendens TaxID=2269 RepID=A0A7J3X7X3_THEPE